MYGDSVLGCTEVPELTWRLHSTGAETPIEEQPSPGKPRRVHFDTQLELVRSGSDSGQTDTLGLGKAYILESLRRPAHGSDSDDSARESVHKKIGELAATSICGNDITASCFYVVGELTKNAGIYAPICTVLSSLTLYCFRGIYGEVVTALPLNGGIYNLLLNSSSKRTASIAACLTILSYTATGVVSAVSAADYFVNSPLGDGLVSVVPLAVAILLFFAVLMVLGMKESSVVAAALFIFHLLTLFVLSVQSVVHLCQYGLGQLEENMSWPQQPSLWRSIFFGFSSAMLGVSGFETSANFVEEQEPGVFPKTLTNMWLSVSVINITLPMLSIAVCPMDDLIGKESAFALGLLAQRVSGPVMFNIVALDALLVLSGSVLTSYVGVCGLALRMAGDRCLPTLFGAVNACRGTPHYTIVFFFSLCSSLCILMKGNISMLAAVYSLSFLLVMALFAFCGVFMKIKRPFLPRQIITPVGQFVLGFCLVSIAFAAVCVLHPEMLNYFYVYYGLTVLVVMTAFMRVYIFLGFLWLASNSKVAQHVLAALVEEDPKDWILEEIARLWTLSVVYFTKHSNLSLINRALQYIEENEEARHVRIIHVYKEGQPPPYHLMECVHVLDCVYPKIRIDCIVLPGVFGPSIIQHVTDMIGVAPNCMFLNCPRKLLHPLDDFGGVRVILNSETGTLMEKVKRSARLRSGSFGLRQRSALRCDTSTSPIPSSAYEQLKATEQEECDSPRRRVEEMKDM